MPTDIATFSKLQRELYDLMHSISEACYFAGWMEGNEHTLWEMVENRDTERNYGFGVVREDEIQTMRRLAHAMGGWIAWFDDGDDPSMPNHKWGARFVPMDAWKARHKKYMDEWAAIEAALKKGKTDD